MLLGSARHPLEKPLERRRPKITDVALEPEPELAGAPAWTPIEREGRLEVTEGVGQKQSYLVVGSPLAVAPEDEAALKVATEGLRWVAGADGVGPHEMTAFEAALGLPEIHRAQAGLLADMNLAADALYGVTMQEAGVSRIVSVDLRPQPEALAS